MPTLYEYIHLNNKGTRLYYFFTRQVDADIAKVSLIVTGIELVYLEQGPKFT
jgi:hypothetical protein